MDRPPPPPGIDLTEDRRAAIVATSVITWVMALVAIGLRIVCRRMKGVELWLDDWLILAAVPPSCLHVFGMAGYGQFILGPPVSRGVGQHIWVTPADSVRGWALGLFLAELGYFFTLMCVKWSILSFYWRSFHVRHSIRVPIWTLATIVLLWGIAVILVTLFQCQPTHAFWSRFDPEHPLSPTDYRCSIDNIKFFYANAIPTIVTDVLMLCLPVPYIYSLKLRGGQKMALAGIFLVGTFVTLVSIIRLHYLLKGDLADPDITWNFVDIGLWSVVEGNIAIVCACLPFLRPIVHKFTFGLFNLSSVGSKAPQSSTFNRISRKNHSAHCWEEVGGHGLSSATVQAKGDNESEENPFALETIRSLESTTSPKKDEVVSTNLKAGNHPKNSSLGEGIMVTREIVMKRDTVHKDLDMC
ncbi:hypothetical protein QQS21_000100 [Conoideocrella luteorostrata]|uniref:Rhodopsin domain-containing protein n=1 Tax=Conoideocrella luteorostrata TaxID=1105319 RepID=A0AAJ0D228_9HYPO|nr:hypothetical protein QQS21_000100 [Conoideocrella luteorostrata]